MRYSTQIKPIIITRNGEATAVLQDVASYEATQETLAMMKIIERGRADIAAGRAKPFQKVLDRLRAEGAALK